MSNSDATDFDRWLADTFAATGGFTALILLIEIGADSVVPVASSYLHIIGDEAAWPEFAALFERSGKPWNGVSLLAEAAAEGGPVMDFLARERLRERAEAVNEDRMRLNEGGFFDRFGRAMRVDPIT